MRSISSSANAGLSAGRSVARDNQITKGLVFCTDRMLERSATVRDIVGLVGPAVNESSNLSLLTPVIMGSRWGLLTGIGSTTDGSEFLLPTAALNAMFAATGAASVFALFCCVNDDTTGNRSGVTLRSQSWAGSEHYPYTVAGGKLQLATFLDSRWIDATPQTNLFAPHSFCVTHRRSEQVAYVNAIRIASASSTAIPSALSPRFAGGNGTGACTLTFLLAFWNRALSAGEVAALDVNPWLLFSKKRRLPMTVSSAVATYTLTSATYVPGSLTSTSVTPRIVRTKA